MSNPFHYILIITTLGLFSFSTTHVLADEMDMTRMLETIAQRLSDDNARQAAIATGEERALFCKYCHGSDGNSLKPNVPNLAGQNAYYLLEQIEKFASKQRYDYVMTPLAAGFSTEDKINVAIFYYSKSVKQQAVDAKLAAKGKALFEDSCSHCHGAQGHGTQEHARLAGQKMIYVTNTLKAFRDNANNPAAKADSSRQSETMEGIMKDLSDEQIEAVAAYVAQLP